MTDHPAPKALIFDVFGTCVDWRSSVARAVHAALPTVDALAFTDAWRAEYQPAMARVRDGARAYEPLDILHGENLARVCARFAVPCPADLNAALNAAWERLDPWPDVVAGLTRLKRHAIIAPCSNGSIAVMTRLARHGGLPWDCILGADIARDYKPKRAVYDAACAALRLDPGEVMMVAAHNDDLAGRTRIRIADRFRTASHRTRSKPAHRPTPRGRLGCDRPGFRRFGADAFWRGQPMTADEIIGHLGLAPHPEGGWYRETWRAAAPKGQRPSGTAIHFLLKAGRSQPLAPGRCRRTLALAQRRAA